MATALDVINEWAAGSSEKQEAVKTRSGLILRLLNQGQLRYAEKSELLRDVWLPTVTSTGNIDLPSNFISEFPDRVKRDTNSTLFEPLFKIDYWDAIHGSFNSLTHYSIYNGKFYVWEAQACTPSIPYKKKPALLTSYTGVNDNLEIPTEFQNRLVFYLDIKWERKAGKISIVEESVLLKQFDQEAGLDGLKFRHRQDTPPKTRPCLYGI